MPQPGACTFIATQFPVLLWFEGNVCHSFWSQTQSNSWRPFFWSRGIISSTFCPDTLLPGHIELWCPTRSTLRAGCVIFLPRPFVILHTCAALVQMRELVSPESRTNDTPVYQNSCPISGENQSGLIRITNGIVGWRL